MASKRYKLRCEMLKDAIRIMDCCQKSLKNFKLENTMDNISLDCTLEFDSKLSYLEIEKMILKSEDNKTGVELHVAVQTIQPVEKYTGERTVAQDVKSN